MSQVAFISPHDDDHVLFGSFTCIRERALVIVVFDGHKQQAKGCRVTTGERMYETERATAALGLPGILRMGLRDDDPTSTAEKIRMRFDALVSSLGHNGLADIERLYVPAYLDGGHAQHNLCAHAFTGDPRVQERYLTYAYGQKSRNNRDVPVPGRRVDSKEATRTGLLL